MSKSWLEKVEAGVRRASLSQLDAMADILEVDICVLVRDASTPHVVDCLDSIEIGRLRNALLQYDTLSATFRPGRGVPLESLGTGSLARQVEFCWMAFQASRYSALGRELPLLLTAAQGRVAASSDEGTRRVLCQVYQIAASTLRKSEHFGLELIAAERGLAVAEQVDDPALVGAAAFRLVNAVLDAGESRHAAGMSVRAAEAIESDAPTSALPLYGHALLQGAMAAAQHQDRATMRELFAEAEQTGRHLQDDDSFHTSFGPVNVVVHRVAALVALRDGGLAVEQAKLIAPDGLAALPRERRASHLVTLALAQRQAGRREAAELALLDAEQVGAEEVRCRDRSRALIADLLMGTRRKPSTRLVQLADRARVTL